MSNGALALLLLVDGTAVEARDLGRREQQARVEAEVRRMKSRAADQVYMDFRAATIAGGLALTVIVPFLIGRFVMTKTFVLRPDPGVYETDVRGFWEYFVPTYLAGLIPIVLLLGVFLVIRTPWTFRLFSVVCGWALLIATVFLLLPFTQSQWNSAEQRAIAELRETPYPFEKKLRYAPHCESWFFVGENGRKQFEVWQVHMRRTATSGKGCNGVSVYRGWREVGSYVLPEGDTFTRDITVSYPGGTDEFPVQDSSGKRLGWKAFLSTEGANSAAPGASIQMNPIATMVNLPTTNGSVLQFTLDGAGRSRFELR